jgi:hypothetical protein
MREMHSLFLYARNLECLIAMHNCEFHSNFLRFEAIDDEKANDCSLLHLGFVSHARLSWMKRHIRARRADRYPRIDYYCLAYFVRNTDMTERSLIFNRRRHKHIEPLCEQMERAGDVAVSCGS